jgi:hypothetical protein
MVLDLPTIYNRNKKATFGGLYCMQSKEMNEKGNDYKIGIVRLRSQTDIYKQLDSYHISFPWGFEIHNLLLIHNGSKGGKNVCRMRNGL